MTKCYLCGTSENLTDYEFWGQVEWYCGDCFEEMSEENEAESSPQSTDDIIANLVARMAELERRDESQRRLNGVTSQRIAELSQRIDGAHRDIETWAQEVEKMKRELDDKIEMCIDDIVTLDERSQPKDITISVGGARG